MFSTLRMKFGIPGVISVIALVFAMFGGAYAASNSSGGHNATASAKAKQGPRGKTGKTGPAGPLGPVGPQGSSGANGKDGANGSNGETGATGPAGPAGPAGSPWTLGGKLPSESTETGLWGTGENSPEGLRYFPISFGLPLQEAPQAVLVQSNEESAPGCPGRGDDEIPMADPGKLCVYVMPSNNATGLGIERTIYNESFEEYERLGGASPVGALVVADCTAHCFVNGTWAVTAE